MRFYFLMFILALGCQGGSSGLLKPQDVLGAWELKGVQAHGQIISTQSSDRLQYEISKTRFKIISSDDTSVNWVVSAPYHVSGRTIVTDDERNMTLPDYEVLSLTSDSMIIRNTSGHDSGNLVLTRIANHKLATQVLKLTETLEVQIETQGQQNSQTLSAQTTSPSDQFQEEFVSCSLSQNELTISFLKMVKKGTTYSVSTENDHFTLRLAVNFKKSQITEQVKLQDSETSKVTKAFSMRRQEVALNLGLKAECQYSINRTRRLLDIDFSCSQLAVEGTEKPAQIKGKAKCAVYGF